MGLSTPQEQSRRTRSTGHCLSSSRVGPSQKWHTSLERLIPGLPETTYRDPLSYPCPTSTLEKEQTPVSCARLLPASSTPLCSTMLPSTTWIPDMSAPSQQRRPQRPSCMHRLRTSTKCAGWIPRPSSHPRPLFYTRRFSISEEEEEPSPQPSPDACCKKSRGLL